MAYEPRFTITIDGYDYDERNFSADPQSLAGEWAMLGLVEAWVRDNHMELRLSFGHEVADTETTSFDVSVTDIDDEVAQQQVFAQPDEPDDADGDWEYRGCYNSIEYYVCASLEEGDNWWKIEDNNRLREQDGWATITYTQDTPDQFVEEAEEEGGDVAINMLGCDQDVDYEDEQGRNISLYYVCLETSPDIDDMFTLDVYVDHDDENSVDYVIPEDLAEQLSEADEDALFQAILDAIWPDSAVAEAA